MNMKAVHYIILALSAIVSVCSFVGQQFPAEAALATAVAGICSSLMATLGILSPGAGSASSSAPAPSAAPAAVPAAPASSVQASVASATAAGVAQLQASQPAGH